ncbi:MAG: hypothetical protein A3B99_04920 [Candidatus Yanofskybacteria bacterium RIFCSPHIGHO2_02_FULL_44_12b]|uniref:DNA polymerase III subunit delta n=2 Tax=Candidatus Yanofskyibacteriota TaxID=1752733 RepID=A0A1F8GK57_9BACT|nr:MAG: hypothetical protein UW79_C0024G0002 [Candidatus Yanofskybacteria bacterium GW2011_GWA2_44_9]OGN04396.1 MAG: hypothetical protein A2659_03650 [Candidatus Yanofskybacteria bacterium RIFCSPHIGHO2_01_FULL_44_24]OGN16192.1 MAG: hypothetical protein A3B99_04920 [Candidatus Yanofskybacteria bacterium RIFCSPHIGHO2_02_FULL_44_12b]OGN25785.1 MAG: hypothetical protein A2925_01185 [Candidatus Yanofskybacteria bacterium RIFCSPLOWO2_01_FULL_44_22]
MWSVLGHNKNKAYFETVLKNSSASAPGHSALFHAYLFSGQEMIGKKTFALDLYRNVNGREEIRSSDLDFKMIFPRLSEGEAKIYIEDIREIKLFLSLKPNFGPYKFVVIDNAHALTPEASNALLKILEEPPPFSVIILVTSTPKLLPQTILSRCQLIRFIPSVEGALDFIKSKKVKNEDADFLIQMSAGRIGWIEKILESGELKDAKRAVDDFKKLLKEGTFERMIYAKKAYESKSYPALVNFWLDWLHYQLKHGSDIPVSKLKEAAKNLLKLHYLISQPQFNHRLALENFLINL